MKNKTDFIIGLMLIVFCMVMGHQIYLLPPSHSNDLFTATSFPTGILGILFVLSILLIWVSIKQNQTKASWPERPIIMKILLMSLLITAYVIAFIVFGNIAYDALFPIGTSFTVTTFIFLICAQYIANHRKFIQNSIISASMTSACYVAFVFLFKVPLM